MVYFFRPFSLFSLRLSSLPFATIDVQSAFFSPLFNRFQCSSLVAPCFKSFHFVTYRLWVLPFTTLYEVPYAPCIKLFISDVLVSRIITAQTDFFFLLVNRLFRPFLAGIYLFFYQVRLLSIGRNVSRSNRSYFTYAKNTPFGTRTCARAEKRYAGSVCLGVCPQEFGRGRRRGACGGCSEATHAAPPGARRLFHRFGRRRRRRLIRRPARTTRLNPDLRRRRRRPRTAALIIICPLSIYCPRRTCCHFRWPWFVRTFPNNKPVCFYYLPPTNDKQHTTRKP